MDLYGGLGGTPTGSIGVDGLHPTDAGYTKIANIWFDAIKREYEAGALTTTGRAPRLVFDPDTAVTSGARRARVPGRAGPAQ